MQWTLLRVENENVNNFERYRNILYIPSFKEEYEEDGEAEGNTVSKRRSKK